MTPNIQQPDKPDPLKQARDVPEDCLSCRITGAGAFIGLGVYSYFSGQAQLEQQRANILRSGSRFGMRFRKNGITGISLSLIGLGIYRLVV